MYQRSRCEQATVELSLLAEGNNALGNDCTGGSGIFRASKWRSACLKARPGIIESASQNPYGLGVKHPVRILPNETADGAPPPGFLILLLMELDLQRISKGANPQIQKGPTP
jgi:hypothetical protein